MGTRGKGGRSRATSKRLTLWAVLALVAAMLALPASSESAFPGDSGKIAFTSNRDGNLEIYAMNADGSDVKRLTDNPAEDSAAAWSPDGQRIAFERNPTPRRPSS